MAEQMGALMAVFHSLQPSIASAGPGDKDVKTFFDSLKVSQNKSQVTLSATVPLDFIKKLFAEPPPEVIAPEPETAPQPATAPKRKRPMKKR